MTLGLLDHAEALSAINTDQDAAVARDVTGLFAKHGGRSDLAQATHTILPQILDVRGHAAGLLTANWYDGIDPSSTFRAKPYTDIPAEQVSKVIDWALHAPGEQPPQERLVGATQRLVRNVSRQTVVRNAAKEGVRYARYAKPEACAFCRALSMRGSGKEDRKYLYDTEESAEKRKSDGEAYHTNCGCEAVPVRAGQIWTPPAYTADWQKQYNDAAKDTPGGKKYFQRVVAQMRANEPKPEPEAEEDDGADVIQFPQPDPEHLAAREALDAASTFDEIKKAAQDVLPDVYVGIGLEAQFRHADAGSPNLWDLKAPAVQENIKDMVRAVDDVMTKYPDLQLAMIHDVDKSSFSNQPIYKDPYATAGSNWNGTEYENVVSVSRSWLTNVASLQDSWETGIDTGFHYHGDDEHPIYNIVVHEMGHVMQRNAENNGVHITDRDINRALVTHFLTEVYTEQAADSRQEAYHLWLQDNLSGYSTHTTAVVPGRQHAPNVWGVGPINGREALAEAFADVEINGDDAHETSIVLHGLLVNAFNESVEGGNPHGMATAI